MRRKWVKIILVATLIGSNLVWLDIFVSSGISQKSEVLFLKHEVQKLEDNFELTHSVLTDVSRRIPKSELIQIVAEQTKSKPLEQNGSVSVPPMELKYDENNQLQSILVKNE